MKTLDLFAGACGGWSLGLERAGFTTVAACELDPWRRERFLANFPGVRMFEDVRRLRGIDTADLAIDLVCGSPPCQDASAANTKGKGIDSAETGLFMEAIRLVGEIRPRWAAFENSPRLRTRGVDRVLAELEALGYACWPLVVGADDVGAPHIRKRIWIIAADAQRIGVREQPRRRGGADGTGATADGHRRTGGRSRRRKRGDVSAAQTSGDADEAGLAQREGERGYALPQLAALERAVGPRGYQWNGGPGRSLRVASRLPTGLARKHIAAYGDAILPQIAELIGRTIMSVDRA